MSDQVRRYLSMMAALSWVIASGSRAIADVPLAGSEGETDPTQRARPAPAIGGTSTCPRPDAVWASLQTLLPREQLAKGNDAYASSSPVQVLDLGPRFRVIAAGLEREYRDDNRDCEHRARVAAVFVALWLAPDYFGQTGPPPIPVAPPVAPPVSQPLPPSRSVVVDLGATVDAGLSDENRVAPGLTMRLGVGAATWGLVIGATLPIPNKVVSSGLPITEFRAPADISVRARLRGGALAISGEAGLVVALLTERAANLAVSTAGSTVEFGARAACVLRMLPAARVSPFVALHAEIVPRPTSLWALPYGKIGSTPTLWLGATLGASLGL